MSIREDSYWGRKVIIVQSGNNSSYYQKGDTGVVDSDRSSSSTYRVRFDEPCYRGHGIWWVSIVYTIEEYKRAVIEPVESIALLLPE